MSITTMSKHKLIENIGRAKKSAQYSLALVTDTSRSGHAFMTIDEYQHLTDDACESKSLADALAMPSAENIDFDPPPMQAPISRVPDLS